MAVTTLKNPQELTPAYNPMYFLFDSTAKANLGFRYVVRVINSNTTDVIGTYSIKPLPTTLYGEVDISKLIQSQLFADFQQGGSYLSVGHLLNYELEIDEEYYYNIAFSDYGFAGAATWTNFSDPEVNPNGFSRTMISHATLPTYTAGDVVLIEQTPGANYRPELDGVHTVLDVFLSSGVYYTVLDLPWIGSGGVSGGVSSYADGQKTLITGVNSGGFYAFKGAFKFLAFKDYSALDYTLGSDTKQLLTSLTSDIRISRQKPTWLQAYVDNTTNHYAVFNIGGDLYRYKLPAVSYAFDVILFNVLPSTVDIDDEWNGSSWVAFSGTIDLTDVESYTVQVRTSTDTQLSEAQTITLYSECDGHTTYDICFLDRLGSWVTVPFYKGSYMTQDVERSSIRKKYGYYDDAQWTYNISDTGKEIYHVEEEIKYTVNTGILSQAECQYYRELLSTPQAFVSIDGGEFQAIEIVTASMPLHLQRTQRDRKVNLVFTMSVQDEING